MTTTPYVPSDRDPLPSGLIPAERIALTVARSQLERGENPTVNITAVLVMALDRLSGGDATQPGVQAAADDSDPLEPVYRWLVNDLGFPVEVCMTERPAWIDLKRLAAVWHERERSSGHQYDGVTADDYVFWLLEETGWGEQEGSPS